MQKTTAVKAKEFRENISEIFKNCIGKFRKSFQKISEDFEKYVRHFREVISENFENLFRKILRNTLGSKRNITAIFENYFEIFFKNF